MTISEEARQGKAARAYARLRADIERGVLPPGRTLSENELVAYTGASRTPVREALRRLATDGLVDLVPRRPPTVSRISLRGTRALFDFRRIVEPVAVRLVTQKGRHDAAVTEAFLRLMDDFAALRGGTHSSDFTGRFGEAASRFDHLIVEHTANEYLARVIADLRPHLDRLRHIVHMDHGRLEESVQEHLEMCAAIVNGDEDRAAAAITEHLDHVDQSLFRRLLDGNADLLI